MSSRRRGASRGTRVDAMECKDKVAALHECKRAIGLFPQQCYPSSPGAYEGTCDAAEYELKKCLATAVSPKDANLLYDATAPRQARVDANARLQKKLRKFIEPCKP